MNVIFIGSGNLATRLSLHMHKSGMAIRQVYSRTMQNAKSLADKLNCPYTDQLADISTDGDLYVFSLKDAALEEAIAQVPRNNGLWVHTAGSMPMDVFKGYAERYGVIYPFQTFSKGREVKLGNVPFLLEAALDSDAEELRRIAGALTGEVYFLSAEKRKYLHLAGVFASNFTNHMYRLAADILEEQGLPAKMLLPLIGETAAKVHEMPPSEAQTGPAVRNDENVMNKHLALLSNPDVQELYKRISSDIYIKAMKK